MADFGVIQEQGFVTEDKQFGFTPVKESDVNPFETDKRQESTKENK